MNQSFICNSWDAGGSWRTGGGGGCRRVGGGCLQSPAEQGGEVTGA